MSRLIVLDWQHYSDPPPTLTVLAINGSTCEHEPTNSCYRIAYMSRHEKKYEKTDSSADKKRSRHSYVSKEAFDTADSQLYLAVLALSLSGIVT